MNYYNQSPFFEPPPYSQINPRQYQTDLQPFNTRYPQDNIREYVPLGYGRPYYPEIRSYQEFQPPINSRYTDLAYSNQNQNSQFKQPFNQQSDTANKQFTQQKQDLQQQDQQQIYQQTQQKIPQGLNSQYQGNQQTPSQNYQGYQTPQIPVNQLGQRYRDVGGTFSPYFATEQPQNPTLIQNQLNPQQLTSQIPKKSEEDFKQEQIKNKAWIEWQGVKEFAQILREMVCYEMRVEKLKVRLCLQPDFNVLAVHNIVLKLQKDQIQPKEPQDTTKLQNEEYLTVTGFIRGLRFFAIDPDPFDVQLLFQRYLKPKKRLENEIVMDYSQFYALFYPLSRRDIFESKLNTLQMYTEFFNPRTHHLIETLFRILLSQEDAFEVFRREMVRLQIDFEKVWNKMNPMRKPEIQIEDLRRFFLEYGFNFTQEELNLLFYRMDKQRVGSVDYTQFNEEFIPRSNFMQEEAENKK